MVLVGKRRDGHYQEISASERSSSGAEVEMIPGTKLWRRKVPVSPIEQPPRHQACVPLPSQTLPSLAQASDHGSTQARFRTANPLTRIKHHISGCRGAI